MLMLKMLVLKMLLKNKNINKTIHSNIYYKRKLSLFGRDVTQDKQKSLFSLLSLKQNKFQKLDKLKEMLLEPSCFGIR